MEDKRKKPGLLAQIKIAANSFITQLSWANVPSAYAAYVANRITTSTFNYKAAVGNGMENSIVRAALEWIARAFPEAPLEIKSLTKNKQYEVVVDHPLAKLVRQPNKAYTGTKLWQGTIQDWMLNGNAYWMKVRNRQQTPIQLWWVPSFLISPVPSAKSGILVDHYLYRPDPRKDPIRIAVEDVIHFRNGLDPETAGMLGLSPIQSILREIFTDDEAANYTAAMMRNVGIPGLIISPDTGDVDISQEEADRLKSEVKLRTTGDNRGDPIVVSARMKIDKIAFSPEQMNVRELRRIPEERIAAQFGIPPVVLNLGAGLDRSTFGNYEEARKAAYESTIIPMQRDFAEQIALQLLWEFESNSEDFQVEFDFGRMRIMQEDQDKLYERVGKGVQGGYMTVNEARELTGLELLDGGDVLMVPEKSMFVDANGQLAPNTNPDAEALAAVHDQLHSQDNNLENVDSQPNTQDTNQQLPTEGDTGLTPEENIGQDKNPVKYVRIIDTDMRKNGNGVIHVSPSNLRRRL